MQFSSGPGSEAPNAELTQQLWTAYKARGADYAPRTEHIRADGAPSYINRLILEDSPYLIQHAHNPVNWYPWGPEAFDKAEREQKPIFLSIGYSTCHWCHVMERESFEDEGVAELLNQGFVSIKVDREQRPDVDAVYMTAVQLLSGRGGWPMSSLLTSDGKPFYGATYFPRTQFINLLNSASKAWQEQRPQLIAQAERLSQAVAAATSAVGPDGSPDAGIIEESDLAEAVSKSLQRHDAERGGFSSAPKFPHEPELLFLLERALRRGDQSALSAVAISLDHMARGGIYDQVGGGFHRYSTDDQWLVPHFEKMLYNQAHLARAYLLASRLGNDAQERLLQERVARQTLDYVLRDMTSSAGAFYSATDADSEGTEGEFFVWTADEVKAALSSKDAELAIQVFGVTDTGNFEGKNILNLPKSLSEVAREVARDNDSPLTTLLADVDRIRERLYQVREQRPHPLRDEKVVTEWNAMMITTLALTGEALGETRYLEAARRAAEFLWKNNRKADGQLWRAHLAGRSSVAANQYDYAYLLEALLTLYDATSEPEWLARARSTAEVMTTLFWDRAGGGFFMSADDHDGRLLVRPKSPTDGAIPSGNSVAVRALAMLARRTGEQVHAQRARATVATFATQLKAQPTAFAYMLLGLDELQNGPAGPLEYGGGGAVKARAAWKADTSPDRTLVIQLDIGPGWHINSNKPLQEELVASEVALADPEAGVLVSVDYPEPETVTLGFQDEPLAIYQGRVRIKAAINAGSPRPLVTRIRLTIQACDDRLCLLPEELILEVPAG